MCESQGIIKNEIKNGKIQIKHYTEAKNVSGFPHFLNVDNGKSHTGCPKDTDDLYKKLDYNNDKEESKIIEGYSCTMRTLAANTGSSIAVL